MTRRFSVRKCKSLLYGESSYYSTRLYAWRFSEKLISNLDHTWKKRFFLDPRKNGKILYFKSRNEYLEFIINVLNKCDKKFWKKFISVLDYP